MKVRITDAAWENMLHIGRWIKDRSPARAETVVRELYERCESLGHMTRFFPLLPGREESGIRPRAPTATSDCRRGRSAACPARRGRI